MAKKKQYSPEEKKAYHMGRAYAVAKAGGRVNCPDEKTKASFRNGVKAVKGRRKKAKSKNTATVRRRLSCRGQRRCCYRYGGFSGITI